MKKYFISGASVVLLVMFAAVAPLRSFALDALSVFRISQANTIRITVADIQELMDNLDKLGLLPKPDFEKPEISQRPGIIGGVDGPTKTIITGEIKAKQLLGEHANALSSVDEFTAFDFKLPKSEKEAPVLVSAPSGSKDITLDTRAINLALEKVDAKSFLPDSYDGGIVTVATPPVIAAVYDEFVLAATQMPYITAQEGIDLNVIKDVFLSSSILPYNLTQQLAMISVHTRDIYLPVLVGISREVSLNGKTGYIYSASDLNMLFNALGLGSYALGETDSMGDMTAIVWVRDGAVYIIAGQMPEAELAALARSIK